MTKHPQWVSAELYWRPVNSAPLDQTVIAWGNGKMRFMRKDLHGQWRNMMHRPRETPTHWMPLPDAPEKTP